MSVPLNGQVIVLTGAGRGIGRAAAGEMAAQGAIVHIGDIDAEVAATAAAEIADAGGVAHGHACDVTDHDAIGRLLAKIGEAHGHIDVLVNNAGIYPRLKFAETTIEDYDRVMGVNMRGAFSATMAVLPFMTERGGAIVFMSSGAGTLASISQATARSLPLYGAAKAAVDRWALGVSHELAAMGIAGNVLYPGAFVRTGGLEALRLSEDEMAATVGPEFVAPALCWLVQQRVDDMHGQLVRASEFGTVWGPT